MFLAQLILANPAISMIIGMSIVVLAITALEVHESGFNKKALENLEGYTFLPLFFYTNKGVTCYSQHFTLFLK